MILDATKQEADTWKALCDLLCRAYGTSGASNAYRLNVAGAACNLLDRIEAAERGITPKPELVKPPAGVTGATIAAD